MPRRRERGANATLVLALAAGIAALLWALWPGDSLVQRAELQTVDMRFRVRGPRATSGRVVIVEIDDESLREAGPMRWPWPRGMLSKLVERIDAAGARAIGLDIILPEPDPQPGMDAAFARASGSAGNVHHALASSAGRRPGDPSTRMPGHLERFSLTGARKLPPGRLDLAATLRHPGAVLGPVAPLAATCRSAGFVDLAPSADGIYRTFAPVVEHSGKLYPSLALALSLDALGVAPRDVAVRPGRAVDMGTRRMIPVDGLGDTMVDLAGPTGTFERHSARQLLADSAAIPKDAFHEKVVLIGVTATGLLDVRPCPFGATFSGVELQANALDTILMGRPLRVQRPEAVLLTGGLLVLMVGLMISRARAAIGWPACALLIMGYNGLAAWLFGAHQYVLSMATPTLAMLVSLLVGTGHELLLQEYTLAHLRRTLARFVPPELAGRITDQDLAPMMTGQLRDVTVLFADVRGFTAASARIGPERAVTLLNRFFSLMHEGVQQFGGTVDKFMGDELMAVWNAPAEEIDHAGLAVAAAVEMHKRVELRRDEWEFHGMPELEVCIGIATGPVIVGYLGSGERMQYTAVGDAVNLASRLQNAGKELGIPIVISQTTHELTHDMVQSRRLAPMTLHGITGECQAFEVTGLRDTGVSQADGEQ